MPTDPADKDNADLSAPKSALDKDSAGFKR
jgi:hypothetical protein